MAKNNQSAETNDKTAVGTSPDTTSEKTNTASNTFQNAWKQLFQYTKSVEAEMSIRFRKRFKHSLIRYELLSQLFEIAPGSLPIGQLAQRMMGSNGNITGLVDRMILEGLIEKSSSREDRRSINIALTEKGTELFKAMDTAHADWAKSLLQQKLALEDAEKITQLLADSEVSENY